MEIETKLQPVAVKIVEDLDGLSHWEQILALEMVKQSLNAVWLAENAREGNFRGGEENEKI